MGRIGLISRLVECPYVILIHCEYMYYINLTFILFSSVIGLLHVPVTVVILAAISLGD